MRRACAQAERVISARPGAVYAVLADYLTHHPRIMPEPPFSDLEVDSGGIGDGTVFHITVRVAGRHQRVHMLVAEPEPGHVLTETNLDTGVVTRFSVAPGEDGARTLVQMSSAWQPKGGLRALADRLMVAPLMSRTFGKQLRQLSQYMHTVKTPD
jgi:Polyketide cyclase / dehydrase and lipid transport